MKSLKKEEFERKFSERYSDHPEGWRCFYTVDCLGMLSLGIVNGKIGEQYWLKFSSPYSHHCVGFVGTLEEDFPFLKDPFYNKDFGVRFFNLSAEERENLLKKGEIISSLVKKIEIAEERPVEPIDDRKDACIQGPIPKEEKISLKDISPAQRELEIRMNEEIERLNRHATSYIR